MRQAWLVVAVLFLGWANLGYAEDAPKPDEAAKKEAKKAERKAEKKGDTERLWPRGPKIDELKTELGLTDDQIAKMKDALAAVDKKNSELEAQADVKAAEEAVQKAKEALKAAEAKNEEAKGNFDLLAERKKAVVNLLPDDKKVKGGELIHYAPEKEKKEKRKEAKEGKEKKAE